MVIHGDRIRANIRILSSISYRYDDEDEYDEEDDVPEYTLWHIPGVDSTVEQPTSLCGDTCDEMAWFEKRIPAFSGSRWDRPCENCQVRLREYPGSLSPEDPADWSGFSARAFLQRNEPPRINPYDNNRFTVGLPEAYWSSLWLHASSRNQWDLLSENEQRQTLFAGASLVRGDGALSRRAILSISRGASGEGPIFLVGE